MCRLRHLYSDCVCLRDCTHVCERVCLYVGCVAFVLVSGNVCMVIVGACVYVCMFERVCVCMTIVLCLCVCVSGHVCV